MRPSAPVPYSPRKVHFERSKGASGGYFPDSPSSSGPLVPLALCTTDAVFLVKIPQQLYSTDDSTLLQGSLTIWTPTEGLRLVASCSP